MSEGEQLSAGHHHQDMRSQSARPPRGLSRRALLTALGVLPVAALTGCRTADQQTRPTAPPAPPALPAVAAYVVVPGEVFPRAKAVAARFLEALLTYGSQEPPGASLERALLLGAPALDRQVLAQGAAPVLVPGAQSTAQVLYPQLGGLVPVGGGATYAVVMVVVVHRLLTSDGERRESTRTVDLRLRVTNGEWAVEELGSVGGKPVPRPLSTGPAMARVLDDPRIVLPDSARWDLHSDRVDGRVVDLMSELAGRVPYSVTVLRTGHPENVVDGLDARTSNHFLGRAVDVWALDGVPVVQQRGQRDSSAYALLEQVLVPGPANEIGVPNGWDLDGPVRRLFDNAVHDDHFHIGFRRAAG